MRAKSGMTTKVLLNRFHKGSLEPILACLPKAEAAAILQTPISSPDLAPILKDPGSAIGRIHYSWLAPSIQAQPKSLQPILLASLQPDTGQKLEKILKKQAVKAELTPLFKQYILQNFYSSLEDSGITPWEYLPQTSLSFLAGYPKYKLVKIIDYLGIYDLAEEIRHVVDRRYLKSFYHCLNEKKQQFLRQCLHQKEKVKSPRLELEGWHGDCERLETILHKRGLIRLGGSLSGQHKDLIWHISRALDTGRGKLLLQHISKQEIPKVTSALVQQVLSLVNYLKQKSEL